MYINLESQSFFYITNFRESSVIHSCKWLRITSLASHCTLASKWNALAHVCNKMRQLEYCLWSLVCRQLLAEATELETACSNKGHLARLNLSTPSDQNWESREMYWQTGTWPTTGKFPPPPHSLPTEHHSQKCQWQPCSMGKLVSFCPSSQKEYGVSEKLKFPFLTKTKTIWISFQGWGGGGGADLYPGKAIHFPQPKPAWQQQKIKIPISFQGGGWGWTFTMQKLYIFPNPNLLPIEWSSLHLDKATDVHQTLAATFWAAAEFVIFPFPVSEQLSVTRNPCGVARSDPWSWHAAAMHTKQLRTQNLIWFLDSTAVLAKEQQQKHWKNHQVSLPHCQCVWEILTDGGKKKLGESGQR